MKYAIALMIFVCSLMFGQSGKLSLKDGGWGADFDLWRCRLDYKRRDKPPVCIKIDPATGKPAPKHPVKKIAGAVMLEGSTGASNPVRGRLIGESTTKIEAKKAAPKTTSIGPKVRCFSVGTNLDNQWERYPENDANCLDHLKAWRMPGSAELADRLKKAAPKITGILPMDKGSGTGISSLQEALDKGFLPGTPQGMFMICTGTLCGLTEPVDVPAVMEKYLAHHKGESCSHYTEGAIALGMACIYTEDDYSERPKCSDPSRIGPLQSQDGKWHCLKLN